MIRAILHYLFWPFMILVSYQAVRWALRVFENRAGIENSKPGDAPAGEAGESGAGNARSGNPNAGEAGESETGRST